MDTAAAGGVAQSGKGCARLGAGGNALRGLFNRGKKAEAETIEARLVELY